MLISFVIFGLLLYICLFAEVLSGF